MAHRGTYMHEWDGSSMAMKKLYMRRNKLAEPHFESSDAGG